eukprot:TRINITY_DN16952_c0_g1_i1.p2 TRINITY_DN16952_c0_g1~~TRINITY_DN16952_c0_g1_i1.p2  ORF type:complete len:359 (+),score=81.46 TRINITY_DN16952_c0_g1_i1:90-1166(+)
MGRSAPPSPQPSPKVSRPGSPKYAAYPARLQPGASPKAQWRTAAAESPRAGAAEGTGGGDGKSPQLSPARARASPRPCSAAAMAGGAGAACSALDLVIPGLYLGGLDEATQYLAECKRTGESPLAVLSLLDPRDQHQLQPATAPDAAAAADDAGHMRVSVTDSPAADILSELPACCEFIDDSRKVRRGCLVHCRLGRSRSATVCAAYLIARGGAGADDAVATVRRARPSSQPNAGFVRQLALWEEMGCTLPDAVGSAPPPKLTPAHAFYLHCRYQSPPGELRISSGELLRLRDGRWQSPGEADEADEPAPARSAGFCGAWEALCSAAGWFGNAAAEQGADTLHQVPGGARMRQMAPTM